MNLSAGKVHESLAAVPEVHFVLAASMAVAVELEGQLVEG